MKIQIINVTYVENIEIWSCSTFKIFNLFIRIFIVWIFKSISINLRWWKIWLTSLSCRSNKFWTIRFAIDSLWSNEKTIFNKCITIWLIFEKKKIRIRIQRSIFTYFKSISVASIATSFVKSIISIFFVKFTIRFQFEHKHDSIIDRLIVTNKCFICEKFDHFWKKCFNINKFQKRQWHKMQIIQMNFDIDSSDSNSKNWRFTSKTRLMNV